MYFIIKNIFPTLQVIIQLVQHHLVIRYKDKAASRIPMKDMLFLEMNSLVKSDIIITYL